MLEELFTFPVIMIDGDNEERKLRNKPDLGLPTDEEEEFDIVYGQAEYPYWDFIGIEDGWLPSIESFEKASKGIFDACRVRFLHVGERMVPWTRKKFKDEIKKFQAMYEAAHPPKTADKPAKQAIPVITLTADQYKKVIGDGESNDKPKE